MPKVQGMSFYEVLLSLFIISFTILSLTRLHLTSISQSENNFFISCAIFQINSLLHRLQTKPLNFSAEIQEWNKENAQMMPEGSGVVSGSNPYVVTISWYDKARSEKVKLARKISI